MSFPHSHSGAGPLPLDALLRPRSIAIVGASEQPSLGRTLMVSLEKLGFEGRVLPVNPKYDTVFGLPCYPSLAQVPEIPDAAAFCVGYGRVLEGIEQAADRGVSAAAVFDGGFAELGSDGALLQDRIAGICRSASIALCGPNCMGVINPLDRSSLYIQEVRDPSGLAGNVGLISQSGSICIGLLTDVRRFGFSHAISSGNEAVTLMVDYLEALIGDPGTRVIALFIESVRAPERFVAALDAAAAAGKPVVVLKVGQSERTRQAITSHTGGLAGSSRSFSAMLRAHRAIEASDLDDMTEILAACQAQTWPTGRRTTVITASGGQAELILDVAGRADISMPPMPAHLRAEADEKIGRITGDGNPFDAWGSGDFAQNLPIALDILNRNDECDNIVLCSDCAEGQPMGRDERPLANYTRLADAAARSSKPHYVMSMRPGVFSNSHVAHLRAAGIAMVAGTRQGLNAIDRLARWAQPQEPFRPVRPLAGSGIGGALAGAPPRASINEVDAKALLAAEGLPVVREILTHSVEAAREAAARIGYPVVLKGVSDAIAHKSEHGLVRVGIRTSDALETEWASLDAILKGLAGGDARSGIVVQEMIQGLEVFAGVKRDSDFGLMLAFGMGGTAVEVLDDVALCALPLREGDAAAMMRELRAAPLLRTVRGMGEMDTAALVSCLEAFADYAWADRDAIEEIDLNPIMLLAKGKGCRIVDALIVPRSGEL